MHVEMPCLLLMYTGSSQMNTVAQLLIIYIYILFFIDVMPKKYVESLARLVKLNHGGVATLEQIWTGESVEIK